VSDCLLNSYQDVNVLIYRE